MTTRVEVSGTDRIAKTRQEGSKKFWIWAVAIVIGIALIVTTSVIALPDARSESNNRSFDAAAARYQGLADLHAKQAIAQQRNWEATAARYQALADEYISLNVNPLNAYWSATAARYQALGESYLTEAAHDVLASDPELIIARKFYNRSLLHCSVHDSLLTTNPESIFERRGRGC